MALLLLFTAFTVTAAAQKPRGGDPEITLSLKNVTVETVLEQLRSKYGYSFVYKPHELDTQRRVTVEVTHSPIGKVLDIVLAEQPLKYEVKAKIIHITRRAVRQTPRESVAKTISGRVTDEAGLPVVGAAVILKGTTRGVSTGADGAFRMEEIPADAVLSISALGYVVQEIAVGARTTVPVTLKEDTQTLDEVVVVGFGTQKKVNLTGAVESVSSDVFENRPMANVTQMLQGAVPNLNISLADGKPNRSASYNIRDTTSIGAGGSALVLIDGIEGDPAMLNPNDIESVSVLKDAASAAIYGSRAPYGVVLITTKDPSKQKDTFTINYTGNFSIEQPFAVPDVVSDGYVYAYLARESDISHRGADSFNKLNTSQDFSSYAGGMKGWLEDFRVHNLARNPLETVVDRNGRYIYYGNTDYYDALYKDMTFAQSHNVSISGSNGKISHYLSGRIYDYNGLFNYSPDTYRTMNLRSKVTAQVLKWLKVGNNFEYTHDKYHLPSSGEQSDGRGVVWRGINGEGHPSSPIFNPDGTLTHSGASSLGGLATGNNWLDRTTRTLKNTTQVSLSFLDNTLRFTGDFTFRTKNYIQDKKDAAIPYSEKEGEIRYLGKPETGDYMATTTQMTTYIATNAFAEYENTFTQRHYFKALAGYNYEQQDYRSLTAQSYGLIMPDLNDIAFALADEGKTITSSGNRWRYVGLFFRLNYSYDNRYLFEVNGRYDGSSKFPNNSQWGFFPSASAAWRVSEEPFWTVDPRSVSNLKLRVSYGALGNSNVSPYSYIEKFSLSNKYTKGQGGAGNRYLNGQTLTSYVTSPNQIPDNIGWETSKTIDGGIDLGFWDNRIQLSADYYLRKTVDMYTVGPTLPNTYGASAPKGNYADMSTYGYEISLSYNDTFKVGGKPFNLGIKATLADYYSVIDRYNNPTRKLSDYYEGQRIGEMWGYVCTGLFQTEEEIATAFNGNPYKNSLMEIPKDHNARPGDMRFADLNGNNDIDNGGDTVDNPGDRRVIGNSEPRYMYTISLNADWKGIFLSAMFDGVGRQQWYPSAESTFWGQYNRPYNQIPSWHMGNYWTENNRDAYLPRYTSYYPPFYKGLQNTRYIQDVSYFRLKNLQFGYNLPRRWISKIGLSKVSVYFSGENLWSWSPLYRHTRDYDVLVASKASDTDLYSGNRGDAMNYPTMRIFSFGVSITY